MLTPPFLTGRQVAKLVHVDDRTVRNMRARGDLEALPLPGGTGWRYPSDQPALQPFLARLARRAIAVPAAAR